MFWPNDHLRLLIEMLRPMGPELARRWLAVLASVPEDSRAALVEELERRVSELSGEGGVAWGGADAGRAASPADRGMPSRGKASRAAKASPQGGPGGGETGGVGSLADRLAEEVRVVYPPVQRDGYVERTEISYVKGGGAAAEGGGGRAPAAGAEGGGVESGPGPGRRRGA